MSKAALSTWKKLEGSYKVRMINALGRTVAIEGVVFWCALDK